MPDFIRLFSQSRTRTTSTWRWSAWLVTVVTMSLTLGCARKPRSGPPLFVEVGDPVGDTARDPLVPTSPDLVHGTANVVAGTIAFTIRFAPGTFDPSTTRLTIQLDTDQDASTGMRTAIGLGIDYIVDLWAPTHRATIEKAVPTAACTGDSPCYVAVGGAPVDLLSDGMAVTVPLSLIGTQDGRLNFRVVAYAMRPGGPLTTPTVVLDVMPDLVLAPAHIP